MNPAVSDSSDIPACTTGPNPAPPLMAELTSSGRAIARLQKATSLVEALIADGVVFTRDADLVRYRSRRSLSDEQRAELNNLRPEVLFLIGRSDAMPACPKCSGRLLEQFTFDGFANILCPACDRSLGCIPVSPRAIERFGHRCVESLPAFVAKERVFR